MSHYLHIHVVVDKIERMSHDLLVHAVVDKIERACILSCRTIDDGNQEEGVALNQLIISF